MTDQEPPRPGAGALRGGVFCFVIACVIALVPFPTFFVWTIFAFVAFILAIVAMAQGRVGGGIVLLLLCIFVPGPCSLVGTALFAKALSESRSSRSSDYSSSYTPSTPQEPKQPTVKPFEPSRHTGEAVALPTSSSNVEPGTVDVALPQRAPTAQPVEVPSAKPIIALQQVESWPPIDAIAVRNALATKMGSSPPGVTMIPVLEPRIRLRHSSIGSFSWANATLDTFLFTTREDFQFLSLGKETPVIGKEKTKEGKFIGVTPTRVVWWKGTDNAVPKWPSQPHLSLTDVSDSSSAAVTVPYPSLPDDVLIDNVVSYRIETVTLNSDNRVYVLWSAVIKDLAGKKTRWYTTWYDGNSGDLAKQVEIPMEALAGSAQYGVVKDIGPNGIMRTYGAKVGNRIVDPNDLTALPLPTFRDSPRFIRSDELQWEKSVSEDNITTVIVSEAGAILHRASGKRRMVVTIRKENGAYKEVSSAKSTTAAPIKDFVWMKDNYLVQPLGSYFLIVDTERGNILGACEGKSFLAAQDTETLFRIALSVNTAPEVRIFEILKPKYP